MQYTFLRLVFQLNSLERVEREQFALIEKLSTPGCTMQRLCSVTCICVCDAVVHILPASSKQECCGAGLLRVYVREFNT